MLNGVLQHPSEAQCTEWPDERHLPRGLPVQACAQDTVRPR